MAFDYKKEYKEFYAPKGVPHVVHVPAMNFVAVRGMGDPNEEEGEYKKAMELLYGVAYTLKMSPKAGYHMEGYFEYVVPPLEGFWWQEGVQGVDYSAKSSFQWISCIRLPDFVTKEDFDWAKETAAKKKKMDVSRVEFLSLEEGLVVQMMHQGPYDDEPGSVALMDKYLEENGYVNDFSDSRRHHEIYLSDARKTEPSKLKTILRHPIRKKA
ncbi:MAG: GyrI-like domain-containing protein [Spirochaetales bacterium]|nr:GyrI-like domain-containing protein [Candidatus Physcosoma equi]